MKTTGAIEAHKLTDFLNQTLPVKEPLVNGLLHRRDLVAVGARRRNGKTTLVLNLAIAGTTGAQTFLGYEIPRPFTSVLFMLEDDPAELQEKLKLMLAGRPECNNAFLITRESFLKAGVPIDSESEAFRGEVRRIVRDSKPDAIFFDNLAHLVGAEYNNPEKIHSLMMFCYELASDSNAAVVTAAHPKKEDKKNPADLWQSPELFAEEIMGSSHFINTTGSIWLLEKQDEFSLFVGGRQRGNGEWNRVWLTLDDNSWFQVADALMKQLQSVLNTPAREQAWKLLPKEFTYGEGEKLVKAAIKSTSTYNLWMRQCQQVGVVVKDADKLRKVAE